MRISDWSSDVCSSDLAAHSTRQTHPDHELISGFQLLATAFVAQIAVILLIYPVELHQLDIVAGGHCSGDPVEQTFGDAAAQIVAPVLQALIRPELVERLRAIAAAVDGIGRNGSGLQ